jgi:hypothetical protein
VSVHMAPAIEVYNLIARAQRETSVGWLTRPVAMSLASAEKIKGWARTEGQHGIVERVGQT